MTAKSGASHGAHASQPAYGQSIMTTDHQEIMHWVESHGGKPASVRATAHDSDPGILRIDFPGGAGEDTLEPVSWDEWFEKFEDSHLAFLYEPKKKSGEDSTFFKLVKRERMHHKNDNQND